MQSLSWAISFSFTRYVFSRGRTLRHEMMILMENACLLWRLEKHWCILQLSKATTTLTGWPNLCLKTKGNLISHRTLTFVIQFSSDIAILILEYLYDDTFWPSIGLYVWLFLPSSVYFQNANIWEHIQLLNPNLIESCQSQLFWKSCEEYLAGMLTPKPADFNAIICMNRFMLTF